MSDDPYREPALYDLEYHHLSDDIVHYVALSRRFRGPVLELGCGNGRISIPMAQAGAEVHGMDLSQPMLDDLAKKARALPDPARMRLKCKIGDFREISEINRYPLVIWPFNAMHHVTGPADLDRVLQGARRALQAGGTLALDCYLPDRSLYSRDPNQRYEERDFIDPRDGKTLYSWEQGWFDEVEYVHHVVYVYERADGRRDQVHLRLRMFELDELRDRFAENGFTIAKEMGDFDGRPMRKESVKWVVELRRD